MFLSVHLMKQVESKENVKFEFQVLQHQNIKSEV